MASRWSVKACVAPPRLLTSAVVTSLRVFPAASLAGERGTAALMSGQGWPIAGGSLIASQWVLQWVEETTVYETVLAFHDLLAWSEQEGDHVAAHIAAALHAATHRRQPWAGLSLDRPQIMGIVNVTPDSFSDGGAWFDPGRAIAHGLALIEAGADLLDIGGESTRPGALPVDPVEECRRIVPVVRALAAQRITISVDTRHAAVMAAGLDAGAKIINDITALRHDPAALPLLAGCDAGIVLMHMAGDSPQTMQDKPVYDWAPRDVLHPLEQRRAACLAAGIAAERLCYDPGIGFGKDDADNLAILARLGLLHGLGGAVLLGVSRKSMIGRLSRGEPPGHRLAGSLALAMAGLDQGVQILRVHDVADTVQMVALWRAARQGAVVAGGERHA